MGYPDLDPHPKKKGGHSDTQAYDKPHPYACTGVKTAKKKPKVEACSTKVTTPCLRRHRGPHAHDAGPHANGQLARAHTEKRDHTVPAAPTELAHARCSAL